ncbi:MAG: sensor domain-containing diguanylate cyclase [Pirellulaceae bacterium]
MTEQALQTRLLQQFVERAGSLYSLPAVAVEVLQLTGQPRVDSRALKACVEQDPALTSKLLRVVNSSMFGLSREVTDLNQALALLGVKPLKLLVLGFSLPKGLFSGIETHTLEHYWQFTLLKAVAARELCQTFWNGPGDEAFIAGLLQDIGVLVLVQELGDAYLNFLRSVLTHQADLLALETDTLGFDHTTLSARLLEHWNLPTVIVEAVAAMHDPESVAHPTAGDSPLPQILHLASLIASVIVDRRQELVAELLRAADRYRAITVEQIDKLLDSMQERVALMASLFSLRLEQQVSYRDILAQAHAQMAQVAVDVLPDMLGRGRSLVERQSLHLAVERFAQGLVPLDRSPTSAVKTATRAATAMHDPGLCGRIASAITACRTRQQELSLVLLEIDDYADMMVRRGPESTSRMVASLRRAIPSLCDVPCDCLLLGDSRFAVLLRDCDRRQAIGVARSLIDRIADWAVDEGESDTPLATSAGVAALAIPTRHSRSEDLIDAADRCLFAAKTPGGRVVKSIDVLA